MKGPRFFLRHKISSMLSHFFEKILSGNPKHTRENPTGIGVKHEHILFICKNCNCTGSVRTNSWKCFKVFDLFGKDSFILLNNNLCCSQHITCTTVVSETAPCREDLWPPCFGKCFDIGEFLKETLIIIDDPINLGLLEHHFRNPNLVGITCLAPRKTRDPYKIWVSEMMLQQTQVDRVIDYN